MTDKLDQSLDTIMTERKKAPRGRGARPQRRAVSGAAKATVAPVGGVRKASKAARQTERPTAAAASAASGDSKIIVSNLPYDVSETQIKDYFTQTVGLVKKVLLTYGPNGQSRGVATITFGKPSLAAQAAKELDGLKVDNRPMKIEVILGAKDAPEPAPVKSLKDRVAQPKPVTKAKAQPKPATADKPAGEKKDAAGKGGRNRRNPKGKGTARPKPKTAEELDAEMADYWGPGEGAAAANGGAAASGGAVQPPAANGDAAMDDEIM